MCHTKIFQLFYVVHRISYTTFASCGRGLDKKTKHIKMALLLKISVGLRG